MWRKAPINEPTNKPHGTGLVAHQKIGGMYDAGNTYIKARLLMDRFENDIYSYT